MLMCVCAQQWGGWEKGGGLTAEKTYQVSSILD